MKGKSINRFFSKQDLEKILTCSELGFQGGQVNKDGIGNGRAGQLELGFRKGIKYEEI